MKEFKGICAALLTPYNATGQVDHKMLAKQVRRLVEQGIDGFYVCGSTGEAFLLSQDERKAVLETVCDANNGEKLIIAHVGQISTNHALELVHHAKSMGVDALSSIAPFYYKFTNEEIKHYYLQLMEAGELPFFIYNFPAFSGFSLTPELLSELCECPYVAGVKFTSSDFFQMERMKREHPQLTIWNGYDEMLLSGLSAGAGGGIGSTYNVLYKGIRGIYDNYCNGNMEQAYQYQQIVNDMINVLIRYGVIPALKEIWELEGMPCGGCRKPFGRLSIEARETIAKMYRLYLSKIQ